MLPPPTGHLAPRASNACDDPGFGEVQYLPAPHTVVIANGTAAIDHATADIATTAQTTRLVSSRPIRELPRFWLHAREHSTYGASMRDHSAIAS